MFLQDLPKIGELEKYKHQVDNWVTTYIEKNISQYCKLHPNWYSYTLLRTVPPVHA